MAKIIEILGNSGSGKTTLVAELVNTGLFNTGIEEHPVRPFHHESVETNPAVALANQIDFLLNRAEQEKTLREGAKPGLLDGGLEQDFFLFTRLFREKLYLDDPCFQVCSRMYRFFRDTLGPPDLLFWIDLPVSEVKNRFQLRGREFEITRSGDLERLDSLLREAIAQLSGWPIIRLDGYQTISQLTATVIQQIQSRNLL
jgi:deoxyadenosine/deoxycytidine kinase